MNQILDTQIKKTNNNKKIMQYKAQFIISIILFIIIVIVYLYIYQTPKKNDTLSKKITNNYSISKLYNNFPSAESQKKYTNDGKIFTIIGMIEIQKINIYYPIISEASDDLLKIAPCRLAGPMPNEIGNLCIAGHNYDNYKFFSKITNLKIDDEIKIYNLNGFYEKYSIFKIYEVSSNDLTPLSQEKDKKKQVTLITCNNFNTSNRFIIQAITP